MTETVDHSALIAEGLALEKALGRAEKLAQDARYREYAAFWKLGDWLVENIDSTGGLTLSEYARASGFHRSNLSRYRTIAEAFPPDVRAPHISITMCSHLLRKHGGDVVAAVADLPSRAAAAEEEKRRPLVNLRPDSRRSRRIRNCKPSTFADVAEFLTASARFVEKAAKVIEGMDLSKSEMDTLTQRVRRIDEALASLPVDRPQRERSVERDEATMKWWRSFRREAA